MKSWRRRLTTALVVTVLLYAALCVLGRLVYRGLLYPAPRGERPAPADARVVTAKAADGVTASGWLFPARAGMTAPTLVIHFHGNGQTMGDCEPHARALNARGLDVLLAEYRGYGLSADAAGPSEDGLYADAAALIDAVARPAGDVVLWGTSLGTGVATEMAKRGKGRALVLVSPFTAIPDVGQRVAPFLPMRLVMGDHYDTRDKAPALTLPVLIVHGDQDEVVPYAMGKALAGTFPHARLVTIEGGHHNDLFVTHDVELYDLIAQQAR